MIDKDLSMSSFLALRYTEKPDVDFTEKLHYRHPQLPDDAERILVHTAQDINDAIEAQLQIIRGGVQENWNSAFRRHGFRNSGIIFARV